jgi:regulator of protease activity HflC (stomatin/prohibitin superfamily)
MHPLKMIRPYPLKRVRLRSYERGIHFKAGEIVEVLGPGTHWLFDPKVEHRVDVLSTRDPWIDHEDLDLLVRAGVLGNEALVIDVRDRQRALVWIDGRFERLLRPGRYALWTSFREVRVEVVDCAALRFEHKELDVILDHPSSRGALERLLVAEGQVGLVYESGELTEELPPGRYAFWAHLATVSFHCVDLRESVIELSGQELMTADKVTLRINAIVSYRVAAVGSAVREVDDFRQALYREAQLALRAVIGSQSLDELLSRKDELSRQLAAQVVEKARSFGLNVTGLGIKDIILPGDMKELLNKVTEARKAAEAAVITRREETAAMRSQLNTAKLMEDNPTLMRLRELETLERVTSGARLTLVVGEKGVTERLLKVV